MAANRFFDCATTTSYLTSNIVECLSRTVTDFYEVSTKSRPKYAEGQVSNFHISHKRGQICIKTKQFYSGLKALTFKSDTGDATS